MPRSARSAQLETRSARLKLPVAWKPIFVKIAPGIGLGYRRNKTAGTWVARKSDGKGGNWTKAIGIADDFDDADGTAVFDYWQAQDRARTVGRLGRSGQGADAKLATVEKALDRYEANLRIRGGDVGNVARVRCHLSDSLKQKTVALLTAAELSGLRDTLAVSLAPASVNRTTAVLKAALNLEADRDERVVSRRAWEVGLKTIEGAQESRNVILSDGTIRALVAAAHEQSPEFGLLVEVAAVTGARVSQLGRLEVQDLQGNRADARVMMPSSRKGRGKKKSTRHPVPLSTDIAKRLEKAAVDKQKSARLLVKPSGEPWQKSDHSRLFKRALAKVVKQLSQRPAQSRAVKVDDYDPSEITIYALRHSNIVRRLLAGVPIRIVAAHHDTSVLMIERAYSAHITDHADSLTRGALFELPALSILEAAE